MGKSTLFNALSHAGAAVANFPFCTIQPNVGVVPVQDERLDALARVVQPDRVVPTTIELVDIAGLVKGASQNQGLGNQFLAHIREVEVLVHVVRCFDSKDIIHVAGNVDPAFDKAVIDQELCSKDIETLMRRRDTLQKSASSGDKAARRVCQLVERLVKALENGQQARQVQLRDDEVETVQSWQLLTYKPVVYVANVDEATFGNASEHPYVTQIKHAVEAEGDTVVVICTHLESQIAALPAAEQQDLLLIHNLQVSGVSRLTQACYRLLNLRTYFTAGPREVRAWRIQRGTSAAQAAGLIHSDLEKGFIKAEVIRLEDYLHYQSEAECRKAGKVTLQGKAYVVQDGDVVHFKCRH